MNTANMTKAQLVAALAAATAESFESATPAVPADKPAAKPVVAYVPFTFTNEAELIPIASAATDNAQLAFDTEGDVWADVGKVLLAGKVLGSGSKDEMVKRVKDVWALSTTLPTTIRTSRTDKTKTTAGRKKSGEFKFRTWIVTDTPLAYQQKVIKAYLRFLECGMTHDASMLVIFPNGIDIAPWDNGIASKLNELKAIEDVVKTVQKFVTNASSTIVNRGAGRKADLQKAITPLITILQDTIQNMSA